MIRSTAAAELVNLSGADPRSLADRLEILELTSRAPRFWDDNQPEAYARCFTEDGVYETPVLGYKVQGREALAAACAARGGRDLHYVTGVEIDPNVG